MPTLKFPNQSEPVKENPASQEKLKDPVVVYTNDGKVGRPTGNRSGRGLVYFFPTKVKPGVYFCEAVQEGGKTFAKIGKYREARALQEYDDPSKLTVSGFEIKTQISFNYSETHTDAPIPLVIARFIVNEHGIPKWRVIAQAYSEEQKEALHEKERNEGEFIMDGADSLGEPPEALIVSLATEGEKEKITLHKLRKTSEDEIMKGIEFAKRLGVEEGIIKKSLLIVAADSDFSSFYAKKVVQKLGWQ